MCFMSNASPCASDLNHTRGIAFSICCPAGTNQHALRRVFSAKSSATLNLSELQHQHHPRSMPLMAPCLTHRWLVELPTCEGDVRPNERTAIFAGDIGRPIHCAQMERARGRARRGPRGPGPFLAWRATGVCVHIHSLCRCRFTL